MQSVGFEQNLDALSTIGSSVDLKPALQVVDIKGKANRAGL